VAGTRKAGVSEVIVDVEVFVVHPDRVRFARGPLELLAIAGQSMKERGGQVLDGLEVDAAVIVLEGPGVEDHGAADVHRKAGGLPEEEVIVLSRQSIICVTRHSSFLLALVPTRFVSSVLRATPLAVPAARTYPALPSSSARTVSPEGVPS